MTRLGHRRSERQTHRRFRIPDFRVDWGYYGVRLAIDCDPDHVPLIFLCTILAPRGGEHLHLAHVDCVVEEDKEPRAQRPIVLVVCPP